jgi:homopolymeric O-antigen transport system permease protein
MSQPATVRSQPRPTLARRLRDLWASRELLTNLVRSELKVRYRNSIFGFAWSMVTPLAMMIIFTFIFTRVFRANIEDFPIFFLVGFLPWQYFGNAVQGGMGTIVANGNLIKKVYFPREVLPLAHVGAQSVHFLLSLLVLLAYLVYRGYNFAPTLPLLIVAILLHTVFIAGLTMIFAAANVAFRDLQEFSNVIFLLWFYSTPIIFPLELVPAGYQTVLRFNPMTLYIGLYRNALYSLTWPSAKLLAATAAIAVLTLMVGYVAFLRLSTTFAKEV